MLYIFDINQIPLNPRPDYDAMIVRGQPQAAGRIISLSEDRKTARVIWRGTPGTYAFKPHPRRDICGHSCWRESTGCVRSSAAGSPADLDGEQLFCYSSSMRSKLADGVFAE